MINNESNHLNMIVAKIKIQDEDRHHAINMKQTIDFGAPAHSKG